jgi:23S rRNA (adenine2030-N6)-methyltransferase
MLGYRHAFHAGNHADVLKHCLLTHLLRYLNEKDKPWWFVDTHAGAGIYDLESDAARKVGEFESGIGRLWSLGDLPAPLADYARMVRDLNPDGRLRLYPGSPWLASRVMRKGDQLRLFELHGSDAPLLRHALDPLGKAVKVEQSDGFAALKAVLPPQPRRGLVLIDPSYELKEDYRRVTAALKEGLDRFATGVFVLWYPMLPRMESRDLPDRLKRLPVKRWLHAALRVRAPAPDGLGMYGSGLFVINPPWVTADRMGEVLPYLARHLGQDDQATYTLEYHEA